MARTPQCNGNITEKSTQRAEEILNGFLRMIETGQFPPAVAETNLRAREFDMPSSKWSLPNQLLMFLHGTLDARGYRQWQEVGRQVKHGARAFYIVGPVMKTVVRTNAETGEEEKTSVLVGFHFIPVFRVEDTEGENLPTPDYTPAVLPPLFDVAKAWNIRVTYGPATDRYRGFYQAPRHRGFRQVNGESARIHLCTHDEWVFLHELAHAAQDRLGLLTHGGQDPRQECVAETAAAVLARMYGREGHEQAAARYVQSYVDASHDPQRTLQHLSRWMTEIQKVIHLVLDTAEQAARGRAA